MATPVHANFQDLAVRLITANGRPITIVRSTVNQNTTQPWRVDAGGPEPLKTPTVGAFFSGESVDLLIATLQAIGAPEGARTSVGARETICLIPAKGLNFEIRPKHTIEDGADTWEIKDVQVIRPGPTAIMFSCTLGR